jgi:DNA mismatch repair ATPase MutS
MLDGQMYDSKRKLRQTYRDAGVIEVGDDKSYTNPEYMRRQSASEVKRRKTTQKKKIEASVGKALSRAGFGA